MDWKERPELFCNGKFQIRENVTGDNIVSRFIGIHKVTDGIRVSTELGWSAWLKDCQLIARRIEDMTDEEWDNFLERGYARWNGREFNLLDRAGIYLELASIGVYPFDQRHFADSVIDKKTLTQTQE